MVEARKTEIVYLSLEVSDNDIKRNRVKLILITLY